MLRGTTRASRRAAVAGVVLAVVTALLVAASPYAAADSTTEPDPGEELYLVTLEGPGTAGYRGELTPRDVVDRLRADQDQLVAAVDAPEPVYRWTTALNGFAVRLDAAQARTLAGNPGVALVEKNDRRRLTSRHPGAAAGAPRVASRGRRGASTVIGFVDSGIDPDSRAFSEVAPLGDPPRFNGSCSAVPAEPDWQATDCGRKIVGARWYVAGFGADRVRSGESLSPLDTTGHGTQMASIATGTAEVPVRVSGHRLGRISGVAPRARVAAYKACWSAPNPADDGCATADLVTAIDQATTDRVDVLNVAVAGSRGIDTVERALLGATEAGVVVVGAAGNGGDEAFAAHPSPWVITAGATTGNHRVGSVSGSGVHLQGAMAFRRSVPRSRLVYASGAAAPGASTSEARHCLPGSLDARKVSGAIVVCRRGQSARVEKSRAVQRADGVGMVLANRDAGTTHADLHAVPTVHLTRRDARRLWRWARERDRPRVRLESEGVASAPTLVASYSTSGDPTIPLLKPDVVAPGSEVVAAVPDGWSLATGTSAAAAHVSGRAAALLSRPRATPERVRSALLTTARPIADVPSGRGGAGQVTRRGSPRLSYVVPERRYRAWLSGARRTLNQPTALLVDGRTRVRRTLTNTGDTTLAITAHASGFDHPVRISPTAAELAPGEALTFTVRLDTDGGVGDGVVVWHTDTGAPVRLTVATAR